MSRAYEKLVFSAALVTLGACGDSLRDEGPLCLSKNISRSDKIAGDETGNIIKAALEQPPEKVRSRALECPKSEIFDAFRVTWGLKPGSGMTLEQVKQARATLSGLYLDRLIEEETQGR